MEIKDRIRMIMEREKVPPRVFAETIGVQQSTLSHILNDRNKPSLEVVMKVHQTYNYVNLEWLLYGRGEMLTSTEESSLTSSNGSASPDTWSWKNTIPLPQTHPPAASRGRAGFRQTETQSWGTAQASCTLPCPAPSCAR